MIRLVATDLDGTLLRSDATVSPRTSAALKAIEAAGIGLVLVTGRPPRWMHDVATATGHRGVAICANGAYRYDLADERIVERSLLTAPAASIAIERIRRVLPDPAFAVERETAFTREASYHRRWVTAEERVVASVAELLREGPVGKLLVRAESLTGDAILARVGPVLAGLANPTHSSPNDSLLEISAAGVSKASGLTSLCAERGIEPGEVIAFGDMPNDVPMLTWAGRSYAVANAHPAARAAADRVIAGNDDDGVAQVLEALLREAPR